MKDFFFLKVLWGGDRLVLESWYRNHDPWIHPHRFYDEQNLYTLGIDLVSLYLLGARRCVSLVTKRETRFSRNAFLFRHLQHSIHWSWEIIVLTSHPQSNIILTVHSHWFCHRILFLSCISPLFSRTWTPVSRHHDTIFCRFSTGRRTLCCSGVFVGQTACRSGLNRADSPGSECLSL